jgi:hypothetical protein
MKNDSDISSSSNKNNNNTSYALLPVSVGNWFWLPDDNYGWKMAKCVDKEGSKITMKAIVLPSLIDGMTVKSGVTTTTNTNTDDAVGEKKKISWEELTLEHGKFQVVPCNNDEILELGMDPDDTQRTNNNENTNNNKEHSELRKKLTQTSSASVTDVTQLQHLHEASLLNVLANRALQLPFPVGIIHAYINTYITSEYTLKSVPLFLSSPTQLHHIYMYVIYTHQICRRPIRGWVPCLYP